MNKFQKEKLREAENSLRALETPTDPLSPLFYMVFENTLPTEMAYRIIPKSKNIVTERIGQPERRTIYGGWDNWTQVEKDFV